jgi:hypothetical protein
MLQIDEELNKAAFIIDIFKSELQIKNPFKDPKSRLRDLVDTRALLMYLLRRHTQLSMEEIGKFWSTKDYRGKDHTSVLHNVKKAEALLHSKFGDKRFMYKFTMCDRKIKELKPGMSFTHKTAAEELIEAKGLNRRLIHREIYRKQQMSIFFEQLKYLPDQYKSQVEKNLAEWKILL